MATETVGTSMQHPTSTNIFRYVYSGYWEEAWDIRSKGYLFVEGGPWLMISAMGLYVYFCTILGPQIMKNRKPFELRRPMLFYNITTVLLNSYFFACSLYYLRFGLELFNFKFPSQNPNDLTEEDHIKTKLVFFYILTKLYDLSDTFFFVLRKKQNQITSLHLYHHGIVPILGWIVLKIAPTASCLGMFPILNTFIHIIMYSYYALSSFGPRMQPYLWWKKYITQMQLIQFVIYGLYLIPFAMFQEGYPVKFWIYVAAPQPFIFFNMFYQFYKKSYEANNDKQQKLNANKED